MYQRHYKMPIIPKSPFSERKQEPMEVKKERLFYQKPHIRYHNFYGIHWLKSHNRKNIEKQSIFALLPDHGNPVVSAQESPRERKKRLIHEFWDRNWKAEAVKESYVINPKYLFNESTYDKILKLRAVFLEFDEDGSRKMELDEMVEMFNSNKIKATLEELTGLFFKGQKIKREDIDTLGWNFYDFMMFSLNKHEDFRTFMRKIKQQIEDEYNKKLSEVPESYHDANREKKIEKPQTFLPMSFERILDYFILKGKERASQEKITRAIEEMDKIMLRTNPNENSLKYYDNQWKVINFKEILEEFNNWFNYNVSLDSSKTSQASPRKPMMSNKISNDNSLLLTPIIPNASMDSSWVSNNLIKNPLKPLIKDIILETGTKPRLKLRNVTKGEKYLKQQSQGASTRYDSVVMFQSICNKNNSSCNLQDKSLQQSQITSLKSWNNNPNTRNDSNRDWLLFSEKYKTSQGYHQKRPKKLKKLDYLPNHSE